MATTTESDEKTTLNLSKSIRMNQQIHRIALELSREEKNKGGKEIKYLQKITYTIALRVYFLHIDVCVVRVK